MPCGQAKPQTNGLKGCSILSRQHTFVLEWQFDSVRQGSGKDAMGKSVELLTL